MTKQELINARRKVLNDTIQHFNANNRCVTKNDSCKYIRVRNGEIHGCAVGRLIQDKKLCRLFDREAEGPVYALFERLPNEVQALGKSFLNDLQVLHDTVGYWTEDGLSVQGKGWVKAMRTKHL